MADDGSGVVADEQDLPAHPQNTATTLTPRDVYRNASITIGAPVPDNDPVLGSPSVVVMVAGPPVTQTANAVREEEVGPGMTIGFLSLDDYKFIMSLVVLEEEH